MNVPGGNITRCALSWIRCSLQGRTNIPYTALRSLFSTLQY
jgi:hypothetical protein